nr:CBS domain-containing protein [Agitococcus sp.]
AEDFALSHPGGALGRKLLLRVSDLMHKGDTIPIVQESTLIKDALLEISKKGLGMTAVVNHTGQLTGIYTDGDLRRTLDLELNIRTTPIVQVMSKNPKTIRPQLLAAEAVALMEEKKINGVIVVDDNHQPVGALNMHDLLKAGVV